MKGFHSTVSRRDFMKGLGLAGAGLGAAAALAPPFVDLDDAASQGGISKAWFEKELEFETLSRAEIDWNVIQRTDRNTQKWVFNSDPDLDRIQYVKDREPGYQGPSLRDYAMTAASSASAKGRVSPDFTGQMAGVSVKGAADYELPKWNGTPEENLRTLWSASRFFGANQIGVVPITANTKKLIYLNNGKNKPYNFTNDAVAEEKDTEYILPNKCNNMLVFTTLEATTQARSAPGPTWSGYDHYNRVTNRIHYFLEAMGYQHIDMGGVSASNPWGALAGVGEHSRAGFLLTSYKFGNMNRGMHRIMTDMPLEATHPVNTGVARFCVDCMTCATYCPYGSMPMDDVRWDHWNPADEAIGNYTKGWKGWRTAFAEKGCPKCKACHGACPFNGSDATIHQLVRATQAVTPIFNGFFANMEHSFGYGPSNPDDFWDIAMPVGRWDDHFIRTQ